MLIFRPYSTNLGRGIIHFSQSLNEKAVAYLQLSSLSIFVSHFYNYLCLVYIISCMKKKLKAVLFDMDGVLFNSMPYHSEAWHNVMKSHGLTLSREEAYMHEGRTGAGTINIVFQRELGREATQEEIESIYKEKSILFNSYAEAERMPGAWELLQQVKNDGLTAMVVTGSGQLSLLERLEHNYPGMFRKELMVTAFDVKYGKPNPEPYLMALKKGGLKADEAVVVENAPLGVEAGHKAGIFTIAVNTGPLDGQVLLDAGADLLLPSMQALSDAWHKLDL